jgi:hypothetical protein
MGGASINFSPIGQGNLSVAAELLREGFPKHQGEFWERSLKSVFAYSDAWGLGSPGHVMHVDGEPVGVLLTIGRRTADGPKIVNLSSWYVRPKFRWLAPRMLMRATSDPSTTYTDLTASEEAAKLNKLLGFRTITETVAYLILPMTAFATRPGTRVVPVSARSMARLDPADRTMLEFHAQLDCICAVVEDEAGSSPLIFTRTSRRGVPFARLIYARDRGVAQAARGAIARFLMLRGLFLLCLFVNRGEPIPSGWFGGGSPVQVKGEWNDGRIDAAYSELAFLGL